MHAEIGPVRMLFCASRTVARWHDLDGRNGGRTWLATIIKDAEGFHELRPRRVTGFSGPFGLFPRAPTSSRQHAA